MILLAVLTYNVVGTRAKGKVFRVAGSAIAVGKQYVNTTAYSWTYPHRVGFGSYLFVENICFIATTDPILRSRSSRDAFPPRRFRKTQQNRAPDRGVSCLKMGSSPLPQ